MKQKNKGKIRVALIGVGNCASSLVQGVYYYGHKATRESTGVMHRKIGPYDIQDIIFSCAFDVNSTKVSQDLSEAIFAKPNCAFKICDVPKLYVPVLKGKTLDGLTPSLREVIYESKEREVSVAKILQKTKTDVVVNYLPTGSDEATQFYAQEALKAGCGFINCIPTPIATNVSLRKKFEKARLPLIGDDIKSQVGATIVNRVLLKLCEDRGLKIIKNSQLNYGGNTDFLNFIDRAQAKERSKIQSLKGILSEKNKSAMIDASLHFDPTRGDQKLAQIHIEAEGFGKAITKIEVRLEVEDSPNSAGVVIDAIRCIKLAMDRKVGGVLKGPSAYFMKNSPLIVDDIIAKKETENFISS